MKINFWQGLGVAIIIGWLIAYYFRTHKADAPTNPNSSTQRAV